MSPDDLRYWDGLRGWVSRANKLIEEVERSDTPASEQTGAEIDAQGGSGGGAVAGTTTNGSDPEGAGLSPREIEVLKRIGRGQQYKTIARDLGIKPNTVRSYNERIGRKTGVHPIKSNLVSLAHRMGLIEEPADDS